MNPLITQEQHDANHDEAEAYVWGLWQDWLRESPLNGEGY